MRGALLVAAGVLVGCTAGEKAGDAPAPSVAQGLSPAAAERWRNIKAEIRQRFPNVAQLDIASYATRARTGEPPLLVDVRAAEEYAVSRIEGARNVPSGGEFVGAFDEVARDREIVLYCSVGWRSSQAAEALQAAGYRRVFNLEGSIFEWANSGLPVVNDGGATGFVHPFNKSWGELLRSPLRAP